MKINIYILAVVGFVLFFFPFQHLSAQYYGDRNLSLGLSVNPNMGWLKFDNDKYTQDIKAGFSYGLVADIGFTPNYYFATGLQINTLNHRFTDEEIHETRDFKIQYAEVPLALKLKTDGNHLAKFYALFGFTAGVKLSAKEKINQESTYSKSSAADMFRLGLAMGAGAEWKVGYKHAVMTGLTFNNGFTRAHKKSSSKNPYLSLNVGFLF